MDENEWHNGNLLVGDVLEKIKEIPDSSVDCCISSPPYWGLRDYGTGEWVGGHGDCEHTAIRRKTRKERGGLTDLQAGNEGGFGDESKWTSDKCPTCGANYRDSQWGLERDFKDYLAKLQLLMTEIRRILKPTGSVWINLGDGYGSHRSTEDTKMTAEKQGIKAIPGYEKSRMGIPERFYINCIDDGWTARNHIIWAKSNAMPTSVKDRFQNKWESIFFFVKRRKYFFNLDAVRERPLSEGYRPFNRRIRDAKKLQQMGLDGAMPAAVASEKEIGNYQPGNRSNFGTGKDIKKNMEKARYKDHGSQGQAVSLKERMATKRLDEGMEHDSCLNDPKGKNPGDVIVTSDKPYAVVEREGTIYYRNLPPQDEIRAYLQKKRDLSRLTIDSIEVIFGTQAPHHWFEKGGSYPTREDWLRLKQIFHFGDKYDEVMTTLYEKPAEKMNAPQGKNPGDIFHINPKPFVEAHFATFPPELPERIIRCAVPEKVCKKCGVPVENIMQPTEEYAKLLGKGWHDHENDLEQGMQQKMEKESITASYEKVGEKVCDCNAGFEPGVVFDPFMGSGTVARVALDNNRRWIGIELNPEYVKIIRNRLSNVSESLDQWS